MEVQRPFLDRLLEMYPNLEIHLWDLTRNADDAAYLRTRVTDRVKVIDHLRSNYRCRYPNRDRRRGEPPCLCMTHKPPYEEPYKWYAEQSEYEGAVFVKVDDDVLFLETERFDDLLAPLVEHPRRVMSANVINNAVCAKYDHEIAEMYYPSCGEPGDPANDRDWWA